jgi:hypothetical protein
MPRVIRSIAEATSSAGGNAGTNVINPEETAFATVLVFYIAEPFNRQAGFSGKKPARRETGIFPPAPV